MNTKPETAHDEGQSSDNVPSENLLRNDPELELEPHIHFKTMLVVIAMYITYTANLINIVGAGAFVRDIEAVVGHSDNTIWMTAASTIATTALGLPISQLADYWGRKWFLVVMTSFGFIGTLVVSRASSINTVIAGEVICGLAQSVQFLFHAVASEVLPRKWRSYAQGIMSMGLSSGGIIALLMGGALTKNNPAGFRTFYYVTAGLFGLSVLICLVCYNPPPRKLQTSLTSSEKLKKLDGIGYLLVAPGLVLFSMGLSWSQNPFSWSDAHVIATFVIGIVIIAILIIYETVFKKDGILHHDLFSRGRSFPVALGCLFVEGICFFAANNYFAFEMGTLYTTNSFLVTVRASLIYIIYFAASPLVGYWVYKTKAIRLPAVVAFGFFCLFFVLLATLTTSEASGKHAWGYPVFMGIALAIGLTTLIAAAQLTTPPELIATASSLAIAVRALGGTVGLAIDSALLNHVLTTSLGKTIAEAVLPLGLPKASLESFITALASGNTASLAHIEGVTPPIIGSGVDALKSVYCTGFRHIWITAAVFCAAAFIASFFLTDPKSDFNSKIDAPAETEQELYGVREK